VKMDDNADFKENLAQISDYSVKSLTYYISTYAGDANTSATAAIQFFNGTDAIGAPIDLGTIAFKQLLDAGTVVDIPVSDGLKQDIEDNLLNKHSITIQFVGEVSDAPVLSDIVMALELEALVKVE